MKEELVRRFSQLPNDKRHIYENFHLAQALTSFLDPFLYEELQQTRQEIFATIHDQTLLKEQSAWSRSQIIPTSKEIVRCWQDVLLTPEFHLTIDPQAIGHQLAYDKLKTLRYLLSKQKRLLRRLKMHLTNSNELD